MMTAYGCRLGCPPKTGLCLLNGVVDQTQGAALTVAICVRATLTWLDRRR